MWGPHVSSISGIEKRGADSSVRGLTLDRVRLRNVAARWLLFSDYGAVAQRHMAIVWSCVLLCIAADVIWLPGSGLSFAPSNWTVLLQGFVSCLLAGAFIAFASHRLSTDARRPAVLLRKALLLTDLLWRTVLPIGALLVAGVMLSYVITAANQPLRDNLLANADHLLGFDWPSFLKATNSSPIIVTLLTTAYQSTGLVTELVLVWLVFQRRGERLAELIAVLSLSTVALCITMWLLPAAGAFSYFRPAPQLFDRFAAYGEMWTFGLTFAMLRDGSLAAFDLSTIDGIVSFPSFHTMLGVMTINAARDTRWLLIPVLVVNATMILATMPVGGHHLTDVLAGAGLTIGAALLVRR